MGVIGLTSTLGESSKWPCLKIKNSVISICKIRPFLIREVAVVTMTSSSILRAQLLTKVKEREIPEVAKAVAATAAAAKAAGALAAAANRTLVTTITTAGAAKEAKAVAMPETGRKHPDLLQRIVVPLVAVTPREAKDHVGDHSVARLTKERAKHTASK